MAEAGEGADRRSVTKAMALAGAWAAMATGSDARAGSAASLTAAEARELLKLEPHPTCGYVRLTFLSDTRIAPGGLPAPFEGGRPLGSALIFMVTRDRSVRLHRIRNDQLYHYYLGAPLEVIMLLADGSSKRAIVGPDIAAGHALQLMIPGNTFHTARLISGGELFLGASTEWPGVEPQDVETGDLDALAAKYSDVAADLRDFALTASR